MNKINLTLGDFLQLENELNGFVDQANNVVIYEGFLKQKLSIILKYELKDTVKQLVEEKAKVEEVRHELIKQWGEENKELGTLYINTFLEQKDDEGKVISKKINPNWVEFDKEMGVLLSKEKELTYPDITIEDLKKAGDTKDDYKVLFKLIKEESAN